MTGALSTRRLAELVDALPRLDGDVDDAELIDQIRLLERLKSAAAATQARVAVRFAESQRAAQAAMGVDDGRGIASQIGLAKRESPVRAGRYLGWADVLVGELPQTFAALQRGDITEWRAVLVARGTGRLSREHRALVDAKLGGRLKRHGDRQVDAEVKKIAYPLDPHGYVARTRGAVADRRVTIRPAPDTMALLTGFLPVAQGVAAYASLRQHADSLLSQGDPRSRGQIMADALVERVTGQGTADAVPVQVNLVMTDRAIFNRSDGGSEEPAPGCGCVASTRGRAVAPWSPWTPARACSVRGIRRFLVLRDQICRTPWCNAPIRHADHVIPFEEGGKTSADNGQGLCERCNHAKQAPGWHTAPGPTGAGNEVLTITPTGHRYTSRPPEPPGTGGPRAPTPSRIEFFFWEMREAFWEMRDAA